MTAKVPARRHIGRCVFVGKAMYPDRATAKTVSRCYGGKWRTFQCLPGCGHWHTGSPGEVGRDDHREHHAQKVAAAIARQPELAGIVVGMES